MLLAFVAELPQCLICTAHAANSTDVSNRSWYIFGLTQQVLARYAKVLTEDQNCSLTNNILRISGPAYNMVRRSRETDPHDIDQVQSPEYPAAVRQRRSNGGHDILDTSAEGTDPGNVYQSHRPAEGLHSLEGNQLEGESRREPPAGSQESNSGPHGIPWSASRRSDTTPTLTPRERRQSTPFRIITVAQPTPSDAGSQRHPYELQIDDPEWLDIEWDMQDIIVISRYLHAPPLRGNGRLRCSPFSGILWFIPIAAHAYGPRYVPREGSVKGGLRAVIRVCSFHIKRIMFAQRLSTQSHPSSEDALNIPVKHDQSSRLQHFNALRRWTIPFRIARHVRIEVGPRKACSPLSRVQRVSACSRVSRQLHTVLRLSFQRRFTCILRRNVHPERFEESVVPFVAMLSARVDVTGPSRRVSFTAFSTRRGLSVGAVLFQSGCHSTGVKVSHKLSHRL